MGMVSGTVKGASVSTLLSIYDALFVCLLRHSVPILEGVFYLTFTFLKESKLKNSVPAWSCLNILGMSELFMRAEP